MLASEVEPQASANSEWLFQKVFGDGDFIAAGQLHIPPNGKKPAKASRDNTYVGLITNEPFLY
jgi:centromere protein C